MKVRCDAHSICKGKHIAYNVCPHYNFHEYEGSNCCGYCGSIDSFVICEEPSRKYKLKKLNEISNKKIK